VIKKKQSFNIGKLAEITGLNIQSIRYYENMGLLPKPIRTKSKYRIYDETYLENINFIKNLQELGFSLEEIKELVEIKFANCAIGRDVKILIREKIKELNIEIDKLKSQKKFLEKLDSSCNGKMPVDNCPILNTLNKEPENGCCHH
jgi:MerR family mercuric resistance operon transcriptional regulator